MVFAWMFVRSGARCRVPLSLVPSEFAVIDPGPLVTFFSLHGSRMLSFLHLCGVLVVDVSESLLAITSLDVSVVFFAFVVDRIPHAGRHFVCSITGQCFDVDLSFFFLL